MGQVNPPGWYPQADGSYRYFDGTVWTPHAVPPDAVQTIGAAGAAWERNIILDFLARKRDEYFREAAAHNLPSRRGDAMIEVIWMLESGAHHAPQDPAGGARR